MTDRLIHDVAFMATQHILEIFAPLLREEEQREAFAAVFDGVKAGLECYEIRAKRMARRLSPGKN
jgi:hypothetical protein